MTSNTTDLQKSGSVSELDPKRWLALIVIGIAQLMVVLDATIVNIALPQAATALHISDANRQWIVTAYALPFGALLLLGGRIGDYLGRKKILIIALGGFALASAIGGIAQNFAMLAGARALQGVFAAALAPSTLSMLTVTFRDPKERAKAFAVFGAIAGGGAAVGLVLGGLLTEYATWRWCLLVNIPISVVAIVGTSIYLHESSTERQGSYDILGALLATLGLGMLVWGFNQASSHSWSSPNTWGWLIGAIVLLALFAVLNSRNPHAILPMRILKNRNRAGAYVVGLLVGTGLFAMFLFLTFFLQEVKGWSPVKSGVAFLPFSGGIIIGAGVGSQWVLKVGAKIVVPVGLVLGVGRAALAVPSESHHRLRNCHLAGHFVDRDWHGLHLHVDHQRGLARCGRCRFRCGQRHGQHHSADRRILGHSTVEHLRRQLDHQLHRRPLHRRSCGRRGPRTVQIQSDGVLPGGERSRQRRFQSFDVGQLGKHPWIHGGFRLGRRVPRPRCGRLAPADQRGQTRSRGRRNRHDGHGLTAAPGLSLVQLPGGFCSD